MSSPDELTDLDAILRASLDLDEEERLYLAGLDLPKVWRTRSATATDSLLGRLALFIVVAGFVTWTVAAQPFGFVLSTLGTVGASTVLLTETLGLLVSAGQVLIDLSLNPALGLSQPLLAMLALALLFWPRIKSAPYTPQGVPS